MALQVLMVDDLVVSRIPHSFFKMMTKLLSLDTIAIMSPASIITSNKTPQVVQPVLEMADLTLISGIS